MNTSDSSSAGATTPAWPTAFRALVEQRRTLLLQGPMGWFFQHLADVLIRQGQRVTKVHFNGGDQLFWRHPGALRYTGRIEDLGSWLGTLMRTHRIDAIVLFGQMRPVHCIARDIARELGVQVFVFEEGYLRPNYVTIERRGVNALSRLPRAASFYARRDDLRHAAPLPTHQSTWRSSLVAMSYYLAATLTRPLYPHAVHHRSLNPLAEGLRWLRGFARQAHYRLRERGLQDWLCQPAQARRWFLVPLQVRDDSQIRHHSRFDGMEPFIAEVMASFAAHAPADMLLVIKHHPMDRAYTDYRAFIRQQARALGLAGRVHYLHDQHLPTLLDHTCGVVTVNSTVGLQALHHGAPVITLGESVYGIPGLVHDGPLARFWRAPGQVDTALYRAFRDHLIAHTQLNASFYADTPALQQPPASVAPLAARHHLVPDALDRDAEPVPR